MTAPEATFFRADFGRGDHRETFTELSLEYFDWMAAEIDRRFGIRIPDLVKMDLEDYVHHTVKVGCGLTLGEGGVYFLRDETGRDVAMGGLRRLPQGSAEIVRIYARPDCRGKGYGAAMVDHLLSEARHLGYRRICLDTGVFMTPAQKIYAAAGFALCDPYPGAEPPEELRPFWLYMARDL